MLGLDPLFGVYCLTGVKPAFDAGRNIFIGHVVLKRYQIAKADFCKNIYIWIFFDDVELPQTFAGLFPLPLPLPSWTERLEYRLSGKLGRQPMGLVFSCFQTLGVVALIRSTLVMPNMKEEVSVLKQNKSGKNPTVKMKDNNKDLKETKTVKPRHQWGAWRFRRRGS